MVTYYCTECWMELGNASQRCARCGAEPDKNTKRQYRDKLLAALRHPEPQTVRRVIYILGKRREACAVNALRALYEDSTDPFVQSDIINAMGRIGTPDAKDFVRRALSHPSFLVREAAQAALIRVSDG